MFNRIRAVHIVVNSLEEAAKDYEARFGLKASEPTAQEQTGIRAAVIRMGEAVIEFIEPLDHDQGPLVKFLKTKGEGVYMMAWEVDSVDEAVKEMEAKGIRLTNADAASRAAGANVFVHPKETHGVLIELVEKAK
jgi:methylmalonyl-CoA/ethylmalonyl-CoA epimerase